MRILKQIKPLFTILFSILAKQVIELAGPHQATFKDLVAQLGLAASLRPEEEYTLLAPLNGAFSGRWALLKLCKN